VANEHEVAQVFGNDLFDQIVDLLGEVHALIHALAVAEHACTRIVQIDMPNELSDLLLQTVAQALPGSPPHRKASTRSI